MMSISQSKANIPVRGLKFSKTSVELSPPEHNNLSCDSSASEITKSPKKILSQFPKNEIFVGKHSVVGKNSEIRIPGSTTAISEKQVADHNVTPSGQKVSHKFGQMFHGDAHVPVQESTKSGTNITLNVEEETSSHNSRVRTTCEAASISTEGVSLNMS